MQEIAGEYQQMFDSLGRRYKGRPASEIKPVFRREVKRLGGEFSDAELTDYAARLAEGARIEMRLA